MAPAASRLANETLHDILGYLPAPNLGATRAVSRHFEALVEFAFRDRMRDLAKKFFGHCDIDEFLAILRKSRGAVTGAGAVWFHDPTHDFDIKSFDIKIPFCNWIGWLGFLRDAGWKRRGGTFGEDTVRRGWKRRVIHFTHPLKRGSSVTLTECAGTTVWRSILASDSTIDMNAVSATSFFSFFPDLLEKRQCMVRHSTGTGAGTVAPVTMWTAISDALAMGFTVIADNSNADAPCIACPRLRIRLGGGEGFGMMVHNASLFELFPHDEFGLCARSRFMAIVYNLTFQWSTTCYNTHCEYLNLTQSYRGANLPQVIGLDYFLTNTSTEEHVMYMKMTEEKYRKEPMCWGRVERIDDIEADAREAYIVNSNLRIAGKAALLGFSSSTARLVSLPLDHGIRRFRTLDDLMVVLWMDSMRFLSTSGTWKAQHLRAVELVTEGAFANWHRFALFAPKLTYSSRVAVLPKFDGSSEEETFSWNASMLVVKLSEDSREVLDVVPDDFANIETFVGQYIAGEKGRLDEKRALWPFGPSMENS